MNKELLTLLFPSSVDMGSIGSGKSNDSITVEDVLVKLSYSKLTTEELNFLLAKFLDDNSARSSLYHKIYDDAFVLFEGTELDITKDVLQKVVDCAIIECILDACPICKGTGFLVFDKSVEECTHCHKGKFSWNDFSRHNVMGIDKNTYVKVRKQYSEIISILNNLECTALEKIGDK
tara:strand:- start:1060 stop:1590 length:531 start_codon:yes stop_codon:yes gene_type:complete